MLRDHIIVFLLSFFYICYWVTSLILFFKLSIINKYFFELETTKLFKIKNN